MAHTDTQPSPHRPSNTRPADRTDRSSRPGGRGERPPRLAVEDRGVSEVLGAVLLFGVLISLLVLVQVNAVPAENQQVEFEHSQRVQQDLLALDDAVLSSAMLDAPGSTQVELGARYPTRFFLLNPAVGAGAIETTAPATVAVHNARSETYDSYWNGTAKRYDTRFLRFRPAYNEYATAPVTGFEHGVVANTFDGDTVVPVDGGSFVRGTEITLVTVDGQFSQASGATAAIETVPLSAPARSVPVTNAPGEKLTVNVSTDRTAAFWTDAFADERVTRGGAIETVTVSDGTPHGWLNLTFAPGREYDLRLARVGVGRSFDRSSLGPHYLAPVGDNRSERVYAGASVSLAAQVADRYDNPVGGNVTFTTENGTFRRVDGSKTRQLTLRADGDGVATATFTPFANVSGDATAHATLGDDDIGLDRERVRFAVPVAVDPTEDDTADLDDVSGINPWMAGSIRLESVDLASPPADYDGAKSVSWLNLTLYNNGTTEQELRHVRLLFYLTNDNTKDPADWIRIDGDPGDQADRLGTWERVDRTVEIPVRDTETVRIAIDKNSIGKDVFGVSFRFEDVGGNYFVQVP